MSMRPKASPSAVRAPAIERMSSATSSGALAARSEKASLTSASWSGRRRLGVLDGGEALLHVGRLAAEGDGVALRVAVVAVVALGCLDQRVVVVVAAAAVVAVGQAVVVPPAVVGRLARRAARWRRRRRHRRSRRAGWR
jgi:hypothetical protein